jgi:hypothetical protein
MGKMGDPNRGSIIPVKNNKTRKVIKELFLNDMVIGLCFWSLMMLILNPFVKLPHSLSMVLYVFFIAVSLICLPYSLYKINIALDLAKKGIEITAENISVEHGCFGNKVKFEYEYDGQRYHKVKFFSSIFFPGKERLTLLVDTMNPSKFIILEFKKKSVVSLVRERHS